MRRVLAVGAMVLCGSAASPAPGLVVAGTPLGTPVNYVGAWRGATAVAIGPRLLLSARHLNGAAGHEFVLDGQGYFATRVVSHPTLDIQLIEVDRDLPGWHAVATRVRKGQTVVLGGMGVGAGTVGGGGIGWDNVRAERWGQNKVDRLGNGMLSVRLDRGRQALASEATFALGDSGAGVFVRSSNGALSLVGVAFAADGDGFSAYGSRGYAVDVTKLGAWIAAND